MILSRSYHIPVLLPVIIDFLSVSEGKKYIDATLGGGGMTFEILKRGGTVLGIDRDDEALQYVKNKGTADNLILRQENFKNIGKVARETGFDKASGIIFDLGMSSFQLDESGRGFSFRNNEPLDMRMDKKSETKASDIINLASRGELYEIFSKYSEELNSRAIAEAIFRARSVKKILTTEQLADIIKSQVADQKDIENRTITRIFQALRIAVNDEITNLNTGLNDSIGLLESGRRIAVLSYHSLEDRIVKQVFGKFEKDRILNVNHSNPIRAGFMEIKQNPRARSAKLRLAEKI